MHRGTGFVPADRKAEGLIKDFSIAENCILVDSSTDLAVRS